MLTKDLEPNTLYAFNDLIDPDLDIYLTASYSYPDESPIQLWVYRTDNYLYLTDKGTTTDYWLYTMCDFEAHSKRHMFPALIDIICEFFDVMYQDNAFIASIPLDTTDTSKNLVGDEIDAALLSKLVEKAESICKAIFILCHTLELKR